MGFLFWFFSLISKSADSPRRRAPWTGNCAAMGWCPGRDTTKASLHLGEHGYGVVSILACTEER